MTNIPSLTPIQAIRKLKKAGFVFDRQAKGSHEIWYNPKTKKRVVIPNHPAKTCLAKPLDQSLTSPVLLLMIS